MPDPRIVWFFGPSAAGKDTLARRVASDANDPLRRHLALGDRVGLCAESLDKNVARFRLPAIIVQAARDDETLLVKGQSIDIWDHDPWTGGEPLHLPDQLALAMPGCSQHVVFIWGKPDELYRRCESRARGDKEQADQEGVRFWSAYSPESCAEEQALQRGFVEELGLPVTWVRNDGPMLGIGEQPSVE